MTETIGRLTEGTRQTGEQEQAVDELAPYMAPLTVPPVLCPAADDVPRETEIAVRPTWVRLHPQLPPTLMWGYDGQVPGPTIEVRRGQRVRIAWTNRIPKDAEYPVTSVEVPARAPGTPPASTEPGREGVEPDKDVAALPAWTVTHLHGAQTGGGNDGWADNAVGHGDAQLSEYPNDHQAVQWWYHDHAMNITRWNVMTGLYGTYLLRDDEEDALHLPSGEREIPLLLADRNLDTDEDGRLNGRLLHKTVIVQQSNPETGKPVSVPFTGPYTTVNGRIWPYAEVDAAWYRFRLLNASNARIFQLVLIDEDGNPVPGVVYQIGSDGGLLPRPVPVGFDGELPTLTAAPAERFDLLVDFRALAGRTLRLVNKGPNQPAGVPDPAGDVRYPAVLEFRVGETGEEDIFELPEVLSGSFRRLTHDLPHGHRMVLLTPPATKGAGGHPEIWELTEVEDPSGLRLPADGIVQVTGLDGTTKTYRRTSRTFNDGLGFTIAEGGYEQWSFLNLAPIVHPMHIHLADFQLLGRDAYDVSGFDPALGGTRTPLRYDADRVIPLAPNERGNKDVFRVPGSQMLRVMGRFDGAYGRFMYHCRLLEHEDMGMMRPFVVMPAEAMKFDHGAGHGGHGGHGEGHMG
ncbi:O-aminophenol oxidase PhsA [Streptomyces roseochromogenus]|uniref:Phenoxazinone synthase n=1 Tax=Streptomyces roseochromogenus subsp. oscitans DS 12.976 TaxID=1352936 RepID=V6KR69_STRRC|nr:O-aminophenol oxidase PhsA [Streptomyces roseochromogenus]EST34592.1 phenoxazinone synthase [Streptomyces roseochromogenus subsp. oscitans DS 12.976]